MAYINNNQKDDQIILAAKQGNVKEVEELIQKGHDVNTTDSEGSSPLMYAAESGNIKLVEVLLNNGGYLLQANKCLRTPLHFAMQRGNKEMVVFLLSNGARVGIRDHAGNTPLNLAVIRAAVDIVKLLATPNVIDIPNDRNNTPLDNAIEMYRVAIYNTSDYDIITRFLLSKNAKSLSPVIPEYHHKRMIELNKK